jgi:allophanate hydrolase subunit 1
MAPESLEWVTFSEEEDEPCEAQRIACANQAVAAAIWRRLCECVPGTQRLCVTHRDRTISNSRLMSGLFCCRFCGAHMWLLRMEPIR